MEYEMMDANESDTGGLIALSESIQSRDSMWSSRWITGLTNQMQL